MRITIQYEASWRNSFLSGSNNEPLPKDGRDFIGSGAKLSERNAEGKYSNFIERKIDLDTVMGILNRLIGDQRKLYQARKSAKYFFSELEPYIQYKDLKNKSITNQEMIYIRNVTGSTDQNSFTGAIKNNDPVFNSGYSNELWAVLALDFKALCQFIVDPDFSIINAEKFSPLNILQKFEEINKFKKVEATDYMEEALSKLKSYFPDEKYLDKGMIKPSMFYCAALYLQLSRLQKRFDLSSILTKNGGLNGISKRNFTPKDFMARFTTGSKKLVWGNPYLLKEKRKGEGEIVSMLTKASGMLEIQLEIPQKKAVELKEMIEAAGVSTFYMGKKGLAYVSEIRI